MKMLKISTLVLLVASIVLVASPITVTQAVAKKVTLISQTSTIEITQDQFNASYRVSNPRLRGFTDVAITLGDSSLTIKSTYTPRKGNPEHIASNFAIAATFPVHIYTMKPFIEFKSETINDQAVSKQQQAQARFRDRFGLHNFIVRQIYAQLKTLKAVGSYRAMINSMVIQSGKIVVTVQYYVQSS